MEGPILHPSEQARAHIERTDWSDLGARAASGFVLATAAIFAAWLGGPLLAGACGAAVVAMSYEWARMSEPEQLVPAFAFSLAGSLGAVLLASWLRLDYAVLWLVVCAMVSAMRRKSLIGMIETGGGAIYIGLPAAVFLWLRTRGAEGLETVLALFAIIWVADSFAYFGGKLIGGPKVAEGLSPKKTWSGIIVGVIAGAAAGLGCGTLFHVPPELRVAWFAIGGLIAFTGLMGDLIESFLKRRFGVKDASRLIPGHGGVLDRIDGLMAATLLAGVVFASGVDLRPLFGAGL